MSELTRRITRKAFAFERLSRTPTFKGFQAPGPVFRLMGESGAADRANPGPRPTPLIGRQRELRFIERQWTVAQAGRLKKILICGEAGIGKSRLVDELKRSLHPARARVLELRCAADRMNSAYHPLIELLRDLLGIEDGHGSDDNLQKIESLLPAGDADGAVQLLAALLSVPDTVRDARLDHSGQATRQRTLALLVDCLRRETEKAPVCLIVEDVQWIDPSTHEVLKGLAAGGGQLPLLLLVTERRDGSKRFPLGFHARELRLKRFSRATMEQMIGEACADEVLPSNLIGMIVEKSDGVPLFIEESMRLVLEHAPSPGAATADRQPVWSVPSTINDLLTARLDLLGPAKWLAGLGAAIGREFSLPLLQAVLQHRDAGARHDPEAELQVLLDSGLLIQKGSDRSPSFFFKHALVRDAAYESLLHRDRIHVHRTIAAVIEARFRDLAERQPELLAHHYSEAGMAVEAVLHWEKAARLAASRSALAEAINHLTEGLAASARLTADAERARAELRLQLLLAGQLIAAEGYGAERVERVYLRALELCRRVGDDTALLKAQLGLEGYHFMRANFTQAYEIAAGAAALVHRSSDPMPELQSQWAIANIRFHQGELASAVQQMDSCLSAYAALSSKRSLVQDPGVMCLCYSAWGKWQLGYPDQAIQRARRVMVLAQRSDHKFSMAEAYGFSASVHHFRGESAEALRCADQAIEICEKHGFAVWLAHARLMRGRVLVERGEAEAGIGEMKEAYSRWVATGAMVTVPFHLALRAEGLALAGRPEEGLVLLRSAYAIVSRYGERYYEAEVMRLMGELLLQAEAGDASRTEAEDWFRRAMVCARQRALRAMSLRTAISWSRLMALQGRVADAIGTLRPQYEWFTEGHDTRDLRMARELLEALGSSPVAEKAIRE